MTQDCRPDAISVVETDCAPWLDGLRSADPATHVQATKGLRALLVRAARFDLCRRELSRHDQEALAAQAADDALATLIDKLDDFRGASRFTTWACKFAVREASLRGRRYVSEMMDEGALDG